MTAGLPASVAAITEFVVPRSIPTAVAIAAPSLNRDVPRWPGVMPLPTTVRSRPGPPGDRVAARPSHPGHAEVSLDITRTGDRGGAVPATARSLSAGIALNVLGSGGE